MVCEGLLKFGFSPTLMKLLNQNYLDISPKTGARILQFLRWTGHRCVM